MLTTDLSLRMGAKYEVVSRRFLENPDQFEKAFAQAWFKLTHRDLGPRSRYFGPDVPKEDLIWQDPLPRSNRSSLGEEDINSLKKDILASGPDPSKFIAVAWASASTFRNSDKRGGANGARIRLLPQKDWEANNPSDLAEVLKHLEEVKAKHNDKVSLAELIVLAGCAAIGRRPKRPTTMSRFPSAPAVPTPRRGRRISNPKTI